MTLLLPRTKVLLSTGQRKFARDLVPNVDQIATRFGPITVLSVTEVTQDATVCTVQSGREKNNLTLYEDTTLRVKNKTKDGEDYVRACLLDGRKLHYAITKLEKTCNFVSSCSDECLVTFVDVVLEGAGDDLACREAFVNDKFYIVI